VELINTAGNLGVLRFNHLHPPFDKAAMRRSLLPAVDQQAYMQAAIGTDAGLWRTPAGVFTPGTPLANDAGLEVLTGPRDLEAAKRAAREAGYSGRPIALLAPTDYPVINALATVTADVLRRMDLNVDLQAMDWGTLVQRRASKEPPDKGGWNIFCTTWEGLDVSVPGSHQPIRGNGERAWFGWPTSPELERLRDAWFEAPDQEGEKRIAEEIQLTVWEEVPFIPLGQVFQPMAYRRSITGLVKGGPPLFWGVRRA
jgi:peptide/nickel transport system substrate-binding protein